MDPVALIACSVAILAWGSAGVLDKLAVSRVDPSVAVLLRMISVTCFILVYCIATGRAGQTLVLQPRVYAFLALSGLLGGFIGQLAYFVALKHAPVTQVVPVTATYPVVAFLLAVLFLRENVTVPKVAGVLLVVIGLALVSGNRNGPAPEEKKEAQQIQTPQRETGPARDSPSDGTSIGPDPSRREKAKDGRP